MVQERYLFSRKKSISLLIQIKKSFSRLPTYLPLRRPWLISQGHWSTWMGLWGSLLCRRCSARYACSTCLCHPPHFELHSDSVLGGTRTSLSQFHFIVEPFKEGLLLTTTVLDYPWYRNRRKFLNLESLIPEPHGVVTLLFSSASLGSIYKSSNTVAWSWLVSSDSWNLTPLGLVGS